MRAKAIWWTLALLLLVGMAVVVLASTDASAACVKVYINRATMTPEDSDADGYPDQVKVELSVTGFGGGSQVDTSATLERQGTAVAMKNASFYVDTTAGWVDWLHLSFGDDGGDYTGTIYLNNSGTPSCESRQFSLTLYPPGEYQPRLSAAAVNRSAYPGGVAEFELVIINGGNNPDNITISARSSENWSLAYPIETPTLMAGAAHTIHLQVAVPADATPSTTDQITVTALSRRNASRTAQLVLLATASPQTYAIELTAADNETLVAPGGSTVVALRVGNNGNYPTRIDVLTAPPPLSWTIDLSDTFVNLVPGEDRIINATIGVPSWYTTPPLTRSLIITAEAGNGSATVSVYLSATVVAPDLLLTPQDIRVRGSDLRAGDEVTIEVTVHNQGTAAAEGVRVRMSDGHSFLVDNVSVDAGDQTVAVFNWIAVEGTIHLSVTVDPDEEVLEFDEKNNAASLEIAVGASHGASSGGPSFLPALGAPAVIGLLSAAALRQKRRRS